MDIKKEAKKIQESVKKGAENAGEVKKGFIKGINGKDVAILTSIAVAMTLASNVTTKVFDATVNSASNAITQYEKNKNRISPNAKIAVEMAEWSLAKNTKNEKTMKQILSSPNVSEISLNGLANNRNATSEILELVYLRALEKEKGLNGKQFDLPKIKTAISDNLNRSAELEHIISQSTNDIKKDRGHITSDSDMKSDTKEEMKTVTQKM